MHRRETWPGRNAPGSGGGVSGDELGDLVATHKATVQTQRAAGTRTTPFIVAIIPAHNEADRIGACLTSLRRQSTPPDLVVVVADNCTDTTVDTAAAAGASVVATSGNRDRKAGALNFALERMLDRLDDDDGALIMDADSELDDRFLTAAAAHLWAPTDRPVVARDNPAVATDSPVVGGVGGIFMGTRHLADDDGGFILVRQLQHNEYVRYARQLGRRRGRALVLTGTGTLFRAGALRHVAAARRRGDLPDEAGRGSVYDTASLTEDNELTLSLKRLGYRTRSPQECVVYTAMMPTTARLVEQRRRWQRGALENLGSHGLSRTTAPYLLRQFGTYLGVLFLPLYLVTLTTALVRFGSVSWLHPLWVSVAVVYVAEQAWSVRRGGWRSVGTSLAVVPELWHTVVLNAVYAVSLLGLVAGTGERWGRGIDERAVKQLADPATPPDPEALSGTHDHRQWWRLLLAPVVAVAAVGIVVVLPLVALATAWGAIAVFVLAGFSLTLLRLVPLPMS
jgi:cellulose synthase/poly-beta-1,6-N-acetylglucosamine synthase-like glycosyltransferase